MFLLSTANDDWAGQLLMGADPTDVLVAPPEMAPFLTEVSPFIRIHFSKDAPPGSVWRMQDKAAELILKGLQTDENSNHGG